MTTPFDHDTWWKLYLPYESRWKDWGRVFAYFIPIFLLGTVATAYAFGYAYVHVEEWAPDALNSFTYYLFLLRLSVVILLPIILMLVGWHFIFQQVHEFLSSVYPPAAIEKLTSLIRRRLLGVPHFPPPLGAFIKYPFLRIEDTTLDQGHWARWLGGPAILVIHDGIAVYVERGNQFSRILGPGEPMPLLERYERIKQIIDLKSQVKMGDVNPWTKDGIPIKLSIRAELQINASDNALEKSHKFRFPFDPLAVKTAVETVSVNLTPDGKLNEQSWLDGAWGTVTAFVNGFVAGHSLDELLLAPHAENHTNSNHHAQEAIEQILSREISNQVTEKIQAALNNSGVKILDLQITSVEVPPEIDELRTKYRESVKQKIVTQRNSRAEAEHIRVREQAHADAQHTMLLTIIKRLENVPPEQLTESLTLSLSGLLDQGLDDALIRPLLAKESFAVLERIRKMLNEKF